MAPHVDVALELRRADSGESGAALRSLKVTTGADGEAQVQLGDLEPGAYRVVGRASMDGRPAEARATFVVQAEGHELLDVAAREEVLRELAARSGGDFRKDTLGSPHIKPPRKVRVGSLRTVEIWSSPLMLLLAVALLAAEWTVRRRSGHA